MSEAVKTADEYDVIDHNDTALSPEDLDKIRNWLQPTDYLAESGEFRRHLSSKALGTGLWICETEEYRKWHDSPDHGSLWVKGVPGAGKSVTAAAVAQYLRMTEDCPVLFFFFRNIVAASYSPRGLIRDWLAQLLPYSPRLQIALEARLDSSLSDISDQSLFQLFRDGISCVPKLYCVADALDEMSADNKTFLNELNDLGTYRPQSLKLLITSRPKQYLQSTLRDSSIIQISLQQELVDRDILSYLNQRFDQVLDGQQLDKRPVVEMVAKRSKGLFLYAKLTMDQVEAALKSDVALDVEELGRSLPVGLEQTYDTVLRKQREEHGASIGMQVLVLEAITHASRPVRLNEMAGLVHCLSANAGSPKDYKRLVATCCGPLVEILEDETLQVIHHSFTEFLRGETRNTVQGQSSSQFPVLVSEITHKKMAINCLQYLESGALRHETDSNASITFKRPAFGLTKKEMDDAALTDEKDPFRYQDARLLHPFVQYAVENLSYHASRYDVQDEEFFGKILGFLKPDSIAFRRWLVIQWGSTSREKDSADGLPTALHIAAFCGMSKLALNILQQGHPVSCLDAQDRTPLHWAAVNGHEKVVSLLIERGSAPNAEDICGSKPIHLAARSNHHATVKVLLEAGVAPDTKKTKDDHRYYFCRRPLTKGSCPILYATRGGHTSTILTLIPFCKGEVLEQLLCQSCEYGNTDATLTILSKTDVSANAKFRGGSALYFSCASANVKCVEALIKRGADVSELSNFSPKATRVGGCWLRENKVSPLHRLVRTWGKDNDGASRTILWMLLDAGADLEQTTGAGNTALLLAANSDEKTYRTALRPYALRALLEAGADIRKECRGRTALHHALFQNQDPGSVLLLLEHGSDPNKRDQDGQTPLMLAFEYPYPVAVRSNTLTVARHVLDYGADPHLRNHEGRTAIQQSMCAGVDVFKLMLSRCTDDTLVKECWFDLEHSRFTKFFACYVDLFLARGVNIDMVSKSGRPLYFLCVNSEKRLQILRERGANANVVDNQGNNALHILASSDVIQRPKMEAWIADGLDPLATNNQGHTLLHHVAKEYLPRPQWFSYVRWLIELGISVNAVDEYSRTILHIQQMPVPGDCRAQSNLEYHFLKAINYDDQFDFEVRDRDGLAPIHLAAMRSEIQLTQLIDAGADPSFLTERSQNILHLASAARRPGIVGQILDLYGKFGLQHQQDDLGRTPLHYASSSGKSESVSLLLRHGAKVDTIDHNRQTPLHFCANSRAEQDLWDIRQDDYQAISLPTEDPFRPKYQEPFGFFNWYQVFDKPPVEIRQIYFPPVRTIVSLLLAAGSDPAAFDKHGRRPLDVALRTGCREFVEPFLSDNDLFMKATRSRDENDSANKLVLVRERMRAQMNLIQPRSCLIEHNKELDYVLKHLRWYMDATPDGDIVEIVKTIFYADATTYDNHDNLSGLIDQGNLWALEKLPNLVAHYSSYDPLKALLELKRSGNSLSDTPPYYTCFSALHYACSTAAPKMQVVRFLVEHFHVDVNLPCASLDKGVFDRDAKVVPGGTALHVLASADEWWKLEAMRYLLSNGADVDALDENGQSPLFIAAGLVGTHRDEILGFWRPAAVRILLDHGATINLIDKSGQTPLQMSCSAPPETMQELLNRGAEVNIGGRSILFQALLDQNLTALKTLLNLGLSADVIDETRSIRDVHYTLTKPRMVCAVSAAAYPPTVGASIDKSIPLLRCLVTSGADLYVPLNDEETLIHFLFDFSEFEILDELLKEPCASLIDFSRRDQRGRTVMMAACTWQGVLPGYMHRHWVPKAVGPPIRMIDLEIDATLVDDEGRTALHHLLDNPVMPDDVLLQFISRPEVAPTLHIKDKAGYTPFHYALRILRPDVCELLLSLGASILEFDPNGLTVLHYISMQWSCQQRQSTHEPSNCSIDLVESYSKKCLALWHRFLAENGSINCRDNMGNSPMHAFLRSEGTNRSEVKITIETGHSEHYDKLFPEDSGADVFAINKDGESMLHIVARRPSVGYDNDRLLFEKLMRMGLDPLKEDARGRSSLDVASACGKEEIVRFFQRK
jgi:ankyrin repeat protein